MEEAWQRGAAHINAGCLWVNLRSRVALRLQPDFAASPCSSSRAAVRTCAEAGMRYRLIVLGPPGTRWVDWHQVVALRKRPGLLRDLLPGEAEVEHLLIAREEPGAMEEPDEFDNALSLPPTRCWVSALRLG